MSIFLSFKFKKKIFGQIFFFVLRQHRRSDRELPWHAADRMEDLPAAAVRPAGHRGVRRGGRRGVPEETGEEQEVLLSRGAAWNELLSHMSTFNVNFAEDCINVGLWKHCSAGEAGGGLEAGAMRECCLCFLCVAVDKLLDLLVGLSGVSRLFYAAAVNH